MTVTTWKTPASNNNSPYIPEKTVLPESNTLCGEKHAYSAMAVKKVLNSPLETMITYCDRIRP